MRMPGTWLKSYYQMKSFSELGVEPKFRLSGEKMRIKHVLNKPITVTGFSIDQSRFTEMGNGKRLTIQFLLDGEERVIFTGSTVLQDQITKVKPEDFPFIATIVPLEPNGFKMT